MSSAVAAFHTMYKQLEEKFVNSKRQESLVEMRAESLVEDLRRNSIRSSPGREGVTPLPSNASVLDDGDLMYQILTERLADAEKKESESESIKAKLMAEVSELTAEVDDHNFVIQDEESEVAAMGRQLTWHQEHAREEVEGVSSELEQYRRACGTAEAKESEYESYARTLLAELASLRSELQDSASLGSALSLEKRRSQQYLAELAECDVALAKCESAMIRADQEQEAVKEFDGGAAESRRRLECAEVQLSKARSQAEARASQAAEAELEVATLRGELLIERRRSCNAMEAERRQHQARVAILEKQLHLLTKHAVGHRGSDPDLPAGAGAATCQARRLCIRMDKLRARQ
ncbi:unnamed protein product [Prorocentrum cordatum]|uniref:Cilia- and flagella-associated protein 157 n=1 Tax=Prorocentrum cordatum TaxID=2364126 RepID=A0ABN9UUT5_9DINO|nr:unnamed protein product [Polarella glacialis]